MRGNTAPHAPSPATDWARVAFPRRRGPGSRPPETGQTPAARVPHSEGGRVSATTAAEGGGRTVGRRLCGSALAANEGAEGVLGLVRCTVVFGAFTSAVSARNIFPELRLLLEKVHLSIPVSTKSCFGKKLLYNFGEYA